MIRPRSSLCRRRGLCDRFARPEIVPAAPAPLANIRDQVTNDWINDQAMQRAQRPPPRSRRRPTGNVSLADAMKSRRHCYSAIAADRCPANPDRRRSGKCPAGAKILFTVAPAGAGWPQTQGGGFFVVKVNKITPGNALMSPGLIGQVQGELSQAAAQDYAQQFIADTEAS